MDARDLDDCVAGCARAHQRLLTDLDTRLADGALHPGAPSRLPDWTVGHVLGHLIGNAQAFIRVFEAAARGELGDMYPDGPEGRRTGIEAWSARSAESLVTGVRRSIWTLEGLWAGCTAQGWRGSAVAFGTQFPVADVPRRRWREVEVHQTDLGWGHEPDDWDPDYVRRDLPEFEQRWLARSGSGDRLPATTATWSPGLRLAWLLGRVQPEGAPAGLTL